MNRCQICENISYLATRRSVTASKRQSTNFLHYTTKTRSTAHSATANTITQGLIRPSGYERMLFNENNNLLNSGQTGFQILFWVISSQWKIFFTVSSFPSRLLWNHSILKIIQYTLPLELKPSKNFFTVSYLYPGVFLSLFL